MAVPEQTPYIEYTSNGLTRAFTLGFQCDHKAHLLVKIDDAELVYSSWSLTGGSVTFNTAPASGKKITIQRNTPFERTSEYQNYNQSFRPQAVNADLDRIWWKLQELGLDNIILKNYIDKKDDELKSIIIAEIEAQGVALDQLDEYYKYLMQRLAQIAVDQGWDASFVIDGNKTQKQINDEQENLNKEQITFNKEQLNLNATQNKINLGLESVVQMLAILSPKDNERVFVKSYHAGLNKGGGYFIYDSTKTAINNGGTIINGWVRISFDIVSVTMFGAKGDNLTDDSTAIQNAINAAKQVFVPSGTYLISKTLNILSDHTHLFGEGASSILKQTMDSTKINADTIKIGSTSTAVQFAYVEKLTFLRATNGLYGAAITSQNTLNLTIRDIKTDGLAWSFYFTNRNFGVSISDCNLYNHKVGGIMWDSNTLVSEGIPATNGLSLIRVNMDNMTGVQPTVGGIVWLSGEGIYANNCELIRQKVGLLIKPEKASMSGAHFGKFVNCLFDMCSEYGLMIFPTGGSNVRMLSFTECWFATSGFNGINLVPDATSYINGISFNSCQICNNGQHGVLLASNTNLTDVQILGCILFGNSANATGVYSGIYSGMGSGLIITGVRSYQGKSGYVANQRHGIDIQLGSSDFIITSNILKGNTNIGLNDASGSVAKQVANNIT